MSPSRRSFLATLGTAGALSLTAARTAHAAPWLSARGREGSDRSDRSDWNARIDSDPGLTTSAASDLILLNSNENPHGPAPEALEALRRSFDVAARYPDTPEESLRAAIAAHHGIPLESVLIGCGSTEILAIATDAFTSRARRLVTVAPTFETPRDVAMRKGVPIDEVPVGAELRVDLHAMAARCEGAGLLFVCNPNNPTATLHSLDALVGFIRDVNARAPEAMVLVDEAYFEYVDDPAYGTAIAEAVRNPRVIVSRTFSKVYGMAGLRAGYAVAHPDTIRRLDPYRIPSGVNLFAATAAIASLALPGHVARQRSLNSAARAHAMDAMRRLGYTVVPSQANFFLTDIKRDPRAFQLAMRARGIAVGRPFPPLATHTRISIGTLDEMQHAMTVVAEVLGPA